MQIYTAANNNQDRLSSQRTAQRNRQTRQRRDTKDTQTFLSFLMERTLFDKEEESLRNIDTGLTGKVTVNVDNAVSMEMNTLKEMVGKPVASYYFKKSEEVITMDTKSCIKVNDQVIHVDAQLLFQRLTAAANRHTLN
jgi:hypothetical protein